MSVLRRIAYFQNRRDEAPNQALAKELAESIVAAANAWNKDQFIAVLQKRMTDMSSSQAARLRKVIEAAEKR